MTNASEDWIYIYTADDERLFALKIASTRFNRWTVRDLGGKVLRSYLQVGDPPVWTVEADYVYRDGQLLAAETSAGRRHFHLDHLGTPRAITDGAANRVGLHHYYPFGEEATAFNQDAERMKFTGHERDLGSPAGPGDDLDYMHARFCSPVTGRFVSTDPVPAMRRAFREPQRWNLYTYAASNPLKYIDPTGMILELPSRNYEEELQLIRDALIEAGAADVAAQIEATNVDGTVQVAGLPKELESSSNATVAAVAGVVNDPKQTVKLDVTGRNLSDFGGARTTEKPGKLVIEINPAQLANFRAPMTPTVGLGAGKLRIFFGLTAGEGFMHELGHARAVRRGFPISGETSQKRAVEYENAHRALRQSPMRLYQRIDHSGHSRPPG